jgi:hypothetical protein
MATKATPGKSTGKGTRKTPTSRAKKTTTVKAGAAKKPAPRSRAISEEDIARKAHEIYLERIAKGEPGNHEGDWHKAVEMLRKKK